MIEHLAVKGYRLFKDFETSLQPGMNVLIGANASGKSTLVELLRIIQSCCLGPLKAGIELRRLPGEVFHPAGELSIAWGITVALSGSQRPRRLYHTLEIEGPAARPRITAELLTRLEGRPKAGVCAAGELPPVPLDGDLIEPAEPHRPLVWRSGGQGIISETKSRVSLELGAAEPMLSRLTDDRYYDSYRFRNLLCRWAFYAPFPVSRTATVRWPQPQSAGPALDEDGANLNSALLSLFTNLDFRPQRDDLLSFLAAAIPEFETLTPTPDSSGQYTVLQWREKDIDATLSASDVSDGVLRLLLLGVICCNPYPPSLICIDEPEIGLHPKVLPLVGGLLRRAAQRTQVIVLTHSPELLYGMPLESIGVLRKENGEASIVWPKDHKILYDILTEEVAGERELNYERLSEAFLSGELDQL